MVICLKIILFIIHMVFAITNLIFFFSGKRHDEKLLKVKSIQDDSGIPYTRCDKSEVKRQQIGSNRKGNYLFIII